MLKRTMFFKVFSIITGDRKEAKVAFRFLLSGVRRCWKISKIGNSDEFEEMAKEEFYSAILY